MNVTHTALPWHDLHGQYVIPASHLGRRIGGSTNKQQDREEFAHVICKIERNGNRFSEDEADANSAFIVRACNSHDKLVEVLKAVRDLIQQDRSIPLVLIEAALLEAGEPV